MADEEIKNSEELEEYDDPGEFDIQDDDDIEGVSFSDDIADVTGIDFDRIDEVPMGGTSSGEETSHHTERTEEEILEEKRTAKISIFAMIAHAFLFTIPVVGVVFMTVYIADGNKNIHLRKLAGVWMVLLLLLMTALCVAVIFLGQAGNIPGLPTV